MNRAPFAVSLGANTGDPVAALGEVIRKLRRDKLVALDRTSSLYRTEPVEARPQPPFLNMVIAGEAGIHPGELLSYLLRTESELGRTRSSEKGPRAIDIDLLFYGELVINSEFLTIPHPALRTRRCVLVPLMEVLPEWRHPVTRLTPAETLSLFSARGRVQSTRL